MPCALVIVLCVLSSGCARWYETTAPLQPAPVQPVAVQSVDTIDIETRVIRFTENQSEDLEQMWQVADEGFLDSIQRRNLDANGIRIGLIRGELPPIVQQQLLNSARQNSTDASQVAGLGSDADARMRLIRCRTGGRKELIVRREIDRPLSVVTSIDGLLAGQTFYDRATALFALTPFSEPNGTAILEMVPEVQYGDSQNRYITTDFGMRQELKRPTKVWKPLKFRANLSQGEFLVLAATQPPKSLGGAFFVSETIQQTEEHLVLLIRLSETPLDDLFADETLAAN